ncbi:MAG: PAS domain-containing sensor histidine kinase [Acidobacteria bacterium]|nr:PAS domain-containing sensor histidine kinase [Acidobacteriota bacterium]
MTDDSHYLPSARLPRAAVRDQGATALGQETLLKLLDTSSDSLAVLNPQRQIVYCNETCWRLAGLASLDEAIGMRPGELLRCVNVKQRPGGCGTTDNCRFCELAQALVKGQQGLTTAGRCLIESGDGGLSCDTEYRVQVTPLPEAGPGWVCYLIADISAESKRRALERTFFHDILNRAFSLEGVAEALADDTLSPSERSEFNAMLGVAVRGMTEELRSQRILLAAESGELAADPLPINSLTVLRDAMRTCATFWLEECARLEIQGGAESIEFESDPALLGRVLINLLKNAVEASGPGHSITAGCRRESDEVHFFVHNQQAMEPTVAARVFQRAFSTKGRGRGLGTYGARLLTEQYLGGQISFESDPGSGTTFLVRLPVRKRPSQVEHHEPAVGAAR